MNLFIFGKSTFASCLLGLASFFALLGCAPTTLAARQLEVTVINRTSGERLVPYRYDGKLYVAGTPGDNYSVELKSLRGERVLTVLSVDGINVLTGQTAATLQSGYVINGGQRYAISGWRKSMDDVAQFVFTELPNSYAARTGRPANVGVIGVAVYRERFVPSQPVAVAPSDLRGHARDKSAQPAAPASAPALKAERDDNSTASAADALAEKRVENRAESSESRVAQSADIMKKAKQLGTGHGEREYSPTRYTEFVRNSDTPDEIITLYYDSRTNLIARGIIPASRLPVPQPFPASAGFVPDPRG